LRRSSVRSSWSIACAQKAWRWRTWT
jgi:hypothetical protein